MPASAQQYDGHAKEAALRATAEAFDTSHRVPWQPLPVLDVRDYLAEQNGLNDASSTSALVKTLREACELVGVYVLVGHGLDTKALLQTAREFHALPQSTKDSLCMNTGNRASGVGYLPVNHSQLPTRSTGNANESLVVKRHLSSTTHIDWKDNHAWPDDAWRDRIVRHAQELEKLALRLLPLYAQALDLPADYFEPAFASPMLRMRLTHYPAAPARDQAETVDNAVDADKKSSFGIHPHVDTSFLTLLVADRPGLVVYHPPQKGWMPVHMTPLASTSDNEAMIIVNTGELLRQWSNDRFLSVPHFVEASSNGEDRYAVPFFFNATADYVMKCLPTCRGDKNTENCSSIRYSKRMTVMRRLLQWRRLWGRFLQRYTTAMGSCLHRDRLLKTLQYTLWWYARLALPYAEHAGNLSTEICWARYITRAVEWPTAWEAVWNDSWVPSLGNVTALSGTKLTPRQIALTLGRLLQWSMAVYYPAEHLAFAKWKITPTGVRGHRQEHALAAKYSAWSCRAWLAYIVADLVQTSLALSQSSGTENNATAKQKRHKQWVSLGRNVLFFLPAYHWSLPDWDRKPWLSAPTVNFFMLVEAIVSVYQSMLEQSWFDGDDQNSDEEPGAKYPPFSYEQSQAVAQGE